MRGLLRRASVELGEPLARHPALRVSIVAGGKSAPLDRLVRPVLPGDAAHLDDRQCRSASLTTAVVKPQRKRH